eukprot:Ihof_evm1s845 gene=Ihof_evmTU1s845
MMEPEHTESEHTCFMFDDIIIVPVSKSLNDIERLSKYNSSFHKEPCIVKQTQLHNNQYYLEVAQSLPIPPLDLMSHSLLNDPIIIIGDDAFDSSPDTSSLHYNVTDGASTNAVHSVGSASCYSRLDQSIENVVYVQDSEIDTPTMDLGQGLCDNNRIYTPLIYQEKSMAYCRRCSSTYGSQGTGQDISLRATTDVSTYPSTLSIGSTRNNVHTKRPFWQRGSGFISNFVLWSPVAFTLCLVMFGYLDFVIIICARLVTSTVRKVFYVVVVHLLNIMVLWSYVMAVITEPGVVPSKFAVPEGEVIRDDVTGRVTEIMDTAKCSQPIFTVMSSGAPRLCLHCVLFKPDRSHHCFTCKRCVLRYDHHCPWIANCVGAANHRYFWQFVTFTSLTTIWYMATAAPFMLQVFMPEASNEHTASLALFVLSAIFFLCVTGLALFHTKLLLLNQTTIESQYHPHFIEPTKKPNGFDVGWRNNWTAVMGPNALYWLLPI